MKKFSSLLITMAFFVVLLTAACGAESGSNPTAIVGTLLPENANLTSTPLATSSVETAIATGTETGGLETPTLGSPTSAVTQGVATLSTAGGTTQTPIVPVTGQDIILVECQFCVDTQANALLVLPDTATFNIVSPAASTTTSADIQPRCTTVEVNNGKQVVLCSGPEMTPLVVNICTDANTCTDFPVDLLACPLTQGGQVSPGQTKNAPNTTTTGSTATPLATAAATDTPAIVISTPTP